MLRSDIGIEYYDVVIYSDGGDRTVMIIVSTILACVAVSGVTTAVVLFARMRRLTAEVNAMKDQVQSQGTRASLSC